MSSDPLPPYAATCPKCGAGDLRIKHREFEEAIGDLKVSGEHIHYTCLTCDYAWTGPTLEQAIQQGGQQGGAK